MTRRSFILIAISAMACAGAVAQEEDIFSPKLRITWDDFKKLYDANKAVVIDVRDEGSFSNGHISGARSIPLDTLEKRIAELRKLKKPIVAYCA